MNRRTNKPMTIVKNLVDLAPHYRQFDTQKVSQYMINHILHNFQIAIHRKQQLNKLMQQQKLSQSQKFTITNCGEILQNFFISPADRSPEPNQQYNPVSPSKSPFSFLDYEQLGKQTERDSQCDMPRREPWQKRRDSSNLHNCNKIFIIKKARTLKQDSNSTVRSIRMNQTSTSSFAGRYSHKPQIKKISINNSTMITRMSSRDNTYNQPKQEPYKPKHQIFSKTRSSFYEEKANITSPFAVDHSRLIKLDENKRISQKTLNPLENQKQTNSYISFLRERKQKLENIMKSFDLDELVKKNTKQERDMLMRDSKAQNLAQTYSKVPVLTTDYDGNLMTVTQPRSSNQATVNQPNSPRHKTPYIKFPKYQPHAQGSQAHSVSYKIKDMDDKTKNFLNQILLNSGRNTPTKSAKKIMFNIHNKNEFSRFAGKDKKKSYSKKKITSKISLSDEDYLYEEIDSSAEPSLQVLEYRNGGKHRERSETKESSMRISLKSQKKKTEEDKQNKDQTQSEIKTPKPSEFKIAKSRGILKSEPTYRDPNKPINSITQLDKLNKQAYALKKQRIHPNLLSRKKIPKQNTSQSQCKAIKQASNENTDRNNLSEKFNSPLAGLFEMLVNKGLK